MGVAQWKNHRYVSCVDHVCFATGLVPVYKSRDAIFSGILLTVEGSLMVVYLKPSTSISVIYVLSIINAVGTGLTTRLGYAVASLVAEPQGVGDAITLQNLVQLGANLISLVIAGQIF